jgi:ATP-binding protein involved in chromosome partitioning
MSTSIRRYALPVINGQLCQHFGHCQEFAIIDLEPDTGKIVNSELKTPPPHEPGILPQWLAQNDVHLVIAGGMGMRAKDLFTQQGIEVITGAEPKNPEIIVLEHARGSLITGQNACDH